MVRGGLQQSAQQGVLLAHQPVEVHSPHRGAVPAAAATAAAPSSASADGARSVVCHGRESPRPRPRLVGRRQVVSERPGHAEATAVSAHACVRA